MNGLMSGSFSGGSGVVGPIDGETDTQQAREQQRRQQQRLFEAVLVRQRRPPQFPLLMRKHKAEQTELRRRYQQEEVQLLARQEAELLEKRSQSTRDAENAIRARHEPELAQERDQRAPNRQFARVASPIRQLAEALVDRQALDIQQAREQQRRQQQRLNEAVLVRQQRPPQFPLLMRKHKAEQTELRRRYQQEESQLLARQEAELLEKRAQSARDAENAIRARHEPELAQERDQRAPNRRFAQLAIRIRQLAQAHDDRRAQSWSDISSEELISRYLDFKVRPSREQDKDEICSICLDNLSNEKIAPLACGHEYHKSCIGKWLTRKNFCPLSLVNLTSPLCQFLHLQITGWVVRMGDAAEMVTGTTVHGDETATTLLGPICNGGLWRWFRDSGFRVFLILGVGFDCFPADCDWGPVSYDEYGYSKIGSRFNDWPRTVSDLALNG